MSVTFSVYVEPSGWAISCACRDVVHVASYATYADARDAYAVGVSPVCGDEMCSAYGPGIVATSLVPIPEVNMAGTNALHILDLLGFEFGDGTGGCEASDFLGRVLIAQGAAPSDEGSATFREGNFIHVGRSFGYSEERLVELEEVARFAIENHLEVQWS